MGKIFRTATFFLIPNLITIARLFLMIPFISYYFDYMIYFYALLVITIISDFL